MYIKDELNSNTKSSENNSINSTENSSISTVVSSKEYYEESPYRFYIALSFVLLSFANGFQWVTVSSCFSNFSITYNLPNWKVNMFSLIYMIVYPFICIPQGYLMENYSTLAGIFLASGLTLVGSILKIFVNHSMLVCFIGQILCALGQPPILDSVGKFAARWFNNNSRNFVTTVLCVSNTIGILIGYVFFNFIIDSKIDPSTNPELYKKEFFLNILCQFFLTFVFCLPSFFITFDALTYPTSPSQVNLKPIPLLETLQLLFMNKRFDYLLVSTFFVVGYFDVFGTICYTVFSMYNVTETQSSVVYGVATGFGILSALIISVWVDRTKKFKLTMLLLTFGGIILQTLFTILFEFTLHYSILNPYAVALVMYSLVSMIVIPYYTIGMNYACKITYPLGECINGGLMMSMSQISGIGGTFLCEDVMKRYPDKKYLVNIIMILFFLMAFIFSFFLDDTLDRNEIEET